MNELERKRLEKAGFRVTNVSDFLEMDSDDVEYVEMKVNLSRRVREERKAQGLTQAALAERLGTGQARVAKAEGGDTSFDALIEALVALGLDRREIAAAIAGEGVETGSRVLAAA